MTLLPALNHPSRLSLAAEIHSRPFVHIEGPACVSHLAVYAQEMSAAGHHQLLVSFCQRFGVAAPLASAGHFFHDFGAFRLKWEHHTEFSTYTFIAGQPVAEHWQGAAIRHVPHDWLEQLGGSVLTALHIAVEKGEPVEPGCPRLKSLFCQPPLVGSRVLVNGEVWSDFHISSDGFSRFLVRDTGLRESQTGRLVQRLCEIETYRMMALLALPLAREFSPILDRAEAELIGLGNELSAEQDGRAEAQLLQDISRLAASIQSLSHKGNFRFGAAQAYFRLVEARIAELRESRIEGVPTIGEFLDRRVGPAMAFCLSVAQRLDKLDNKVAHAIDLLRTRVSIEQERQNQAVLQSLHLNSRQQLHLQQAVEGLSVVAITYYATSLLGYLLKSLKGLGFNLPVEILTGALLPLVFTVTWLGLKRFQKHSRRAGA